METSWDDLLREQCGVVTLDQCRASDISDKVVAAHVRAGRWRRLHPAVRLTSGGPSTYEQRVWGGVLAVSGEVALSHETALWWADQRRPEPLLVHVAILDGRGVAPPRGVRLHQLPDLGLERVVPGSPARVRIEHTVVDLERLCPTALALVSLVTGVLRGGLTTPERLRAVVDARPRLRWRREMELLLAEVAGGVHSPLELEDLRNDRRHGLPVGHRQVARRRGGRREWQDVVYDAPGMHRQVVKELDGRVGHDLDVDRFRDMARDTASAVRGQLHARLGWHDLLGTPCATAAITASVLEQAGWRGALRSCGPRCTAAAYRATLLREIAADAP